MRRFPRAAFGAAFLALAAAGVAAAGPPPARVEVVRDTLHGQVIEDPYRWLEDKDSPETRQWVRDQMAFTKEQLAAIPGRDDATQALARYSRLDTRGVPTVRAGRLFFTSRRADQQQRVLVMRASADAPDQVLVDPNALSPDHTTSVALLDVSIDGKLLAYGLRKGGEDELEVHLLDVDTKQEQPGGLPKARYFGLTIDAKKQGAWYGRWEPQGSRIWYMRFGSDPAKAKLVYGDKLGPSEIPVPALSDDGKWLVVAVYVGASGDRTHIYLRDTAKEGAFTSVTDTLNAKVEVAFAGDRLLLTTNWNAANGRVMAVAAREPGLKNWKELVPERKDAAIDGVAAVAGRVLVAYLRNASSELVAYAGDGSKPAPIALPGLGSASTPAGEWAGGDAYYSFSSLNRPVTIYRYDPAAGKSAEWWRSPAVFDPDRFLVRQVKTRSKDGTLVPMFIVQPKDISLDGTNPVLMHGYGGFNVNISPAWSPKVAAWLELGGIYVLANLRGGGEFGENWHKAGMLANKQHTFDDFIGCAQWLEGAGYCRPGKLGIIGDSNGGLLVGASLTQRPDLFGAVVCEVPLLDMLRYHRFLVARFWVPEYGSSEDPVQFQWLNGYSPYQKLVPGTKYPAVMFVTGDADTRVDPLHARKMAARMQALGGERPVLLHYDVSSGHSGGKSVDQSIADDADELQFLRWQLGMVKLP